MEYTLEEVINEIERKKPFNEGKEGKIYELDSSLVAKLSEGIYNRGIIMDSLKERKREAIHNAVNNALDNSKNQEKYEIRLVPILKSFIYGQKSISVMPKIRGSKNRLLTDNLIDKIERTMNCFGVSLDNYPDDIFYCRSGEIIVLETDGFLSPEILKSIESVELTARDKILENVAVTHLLGATSIYPTLGYDEKASYFNWEIFEELYPTLSKIDFDLSKTFDVGVNFVGVSTYCFEGRKMLRKARDHFGPQFIPNKFDWNNGNNLENYGINQEIFHQFRLQVDTSKPEIIELKIFAEKLMDKK